MTRSTTSVPCLLILASALPALFLSAAVYAQDRPELLVEGEEAKKLIVRLSGDGTLGSGIVFHVDGDQVYGVTAKHVVRTGGESKKDLTARLSNWPDRRFGVELERFHHELDLATFKIDVGGLGLEASAIEAAFPLAQLGSSPILDAGAAVHPLGHYGDESWMTPRPAPTYHGVNDLDRRHFLIQHKCPVGNSGGGLFDDSWRLVGMILDSDHILCHVLKIEEVIGVLRSWDYAVALEGRYSRPATAAVEAPRQVTVAVAAFQNASGRRIPGIELAASEVTNSFLVNLPGVTVVTRARLQAVLDELRLEERGLTTRPEDSTRVGKLLGAQYIVTGAVLRYDVERRRARVFNTSALQDDYRMTTSLQLINTVSGEVQFDKIFKTGDAISYPQASSAPRQPLDRGSELLEGLLEEAAPELQNALLLAAVYERAGTRFVAVEISTKPEGAEVEIGDIHRGQTPLTLDLEVGIHEIRLRLTGHKLWQRRIDVRPGYRLDVDLVPAPAGSAASSRP